MAGPAVPCAGIWEGACTIAEAPAAAREEAAVLFTAGAGFAGAKPTSL